MYSISVDSKKPAYARILRLFLSNCIVSPFLTLTGTHVSGTCCGRNLNMGVNETGMADGIAPNAKLAFVDIALNVYNQPPSKFWQLNSRSDQ